MKELVVSELSKEQKLGLLICADLTYQRQELDYVIELIREHKVGGVWIQPTRPDWENTLRRVREAADYPILIFCDCENGFWDAKIPDVNAFGAARDGEKAAFAFGRKTGAMLRNLGYNVVCNPIIDLVSDRSYPCGGNTRSFGPDKTLVARLGGAMARGMHEGGVMTVGKHYPFRRSDTPYDTHMREGYCTLTKEDLCGEAMYALRELMKEDLLDGLMTGHMRLPMIDPDEPASLSGPVIDIARELGFDGFLITDALNMMGILSKHGRREPVAKAIAAGNDIPLNMGLSFRESYEGLIEAYDAGRVRDDMVDVALRRVLTAQHKAAMLPAHSPEYPEDTEEIARVARDSISARVEEGLTPNISRDGRHLFTIVTNERADDFSEEYTPGPRDWFFPRRIATRLLELFPNSEVVFHPLFPEGVDNAPYFGKQRGFDDVVFITNYQSAAYVGREHLTTRIVDLMDALQSTDRIIAHLHYGNPYVAADAPYVPRVLLGYSSEACVMHGLEILAGNAPAVGKCPYTINFHKKGDFIID